MLYDLYVSVFLITILQAGINVYLCVIIWNCDNEIKELKEKIKGEKTNV